MKKVIKLKEVRKARSDFGVSVKTEARNFLREIDNGNCRGAAIVWLDENNDIHVSHCFQSRLQWIGALEGIKQNAWDA